MNKFVHALLACMAVLSAKSQSGYGDALSLCLEATVQANPAQITLSWDATTVDGTYEVYRKLKNFSNWGSPLATLHAKQNRYVDHDVLLNTLYDYRVSVSDKSGMTRHGYLSSGIQVNPNSNRGIALLVIESSFKADPHFAEAIDQTVNDLELDGWFPKLIYVKKNDAVKTVKAAIVKKYNENPSSTKLLFLLGHVPVPYSGNTYPDGHTDHKGAWPTDAYYADMDGVWTDNVVKNSTSVNKRNHNVPGDGKFDQSILPSKLELQVGRVDLNDLPSFAENEKTLLLRYLDKLHRFKTGKLLVTNRALIDDNFSDHQEGFSQNGYRNFSAIVGRKNLVQGDYFTDLSYKKSSSGTYLWSYGCGGGSFCSAEGIGTTLSFTRDSLSSVFSMLYGSYFGDWNYVDAFLRAPLAQGNTLTCAWAGRPNWHFYHMAMGENIGYATQLTQNNKGLFYASSVNSLAQLVSIALMGDPSLRMQYISPPKKLTVEIKRNSATLKWEDNGKTNGFNVYRRYENSTEFVKLNSTPLSGTNFKDDKLKGSEAAYYYVKAVKLTVSPSGSYYNESLGVRAQTKASVAVN